MNVGEARDRVANPSYVETGRAGQHLRDVRRAALAACIAVVLSLAIPMWNFTRQMRALELKIGTFLAIALILVAYIFTAIVPVFYFALYRNEGGLPLSRNKRWISMTAAALVGILMLTKIPGWIGSFRGDSVLDTAARKCAIDDTSAVLGLIADLAGILLLAALYRLASDGASDGSVAASKLLRFLARLAVIGGGIVAICCVVGLAATPWVYFYIRDRSWEMAISNEGWAFSRLAMDRARTALTVISMYVAPFIVWQGARNRVTNTCDSPDHVTDEHHGTRADQC